MENPVSNTDDQTPEKPKARRWWLLPLIALVAVSGMYFWKVLAVRAMEGRCAEREAVIITRDRAVLDSLRSDGLTRNARLLSWAVRSELMRNNLEQVDYYFLAYVKEPNVKQVSLVAPDGMVLRSTDKKFEGEKREVPPGLDGVTIIPGTTGTQVWSPVHGVDAVIGTLAIELVGDGRDMGEASRADDSGGTP